jgi:hypothetical protein
MTISLLRIRQSFGDQILQINGENVAGWSVDKTIKTLKQADGSKITMAVRDRPFERAVTVVKDSSNIVCTLQPFLCWFIFHVSLFARRCLRHLPSSTCLMVAFDSPVVSHSELLLPQVGFTFTICHICSRCCELRG